MHLFVLDYKFVFFNLHEVRGFLLNTSYWKFTPSKSTYHLLQINLFNRKSPFVRSLLKVLMKGQTFANIFKVTGFYKIRCQG